MKKLNILVGGPVDQWPSELTAGAVVGEWIGVDRGAFRLLKLGITPKVAVGDFDSLSETEREWLTTQVQDIRRVKPEKDETDLELALTIAQNEYQADEIVIYGATGGRIDHLLSNIWIFSQPRFQQFIGKVNLVDRGNSIRFYAPGNHTIVKEADKKYLGFINLTAVEHLDLADERYELHDWSSPTPYSWSSNEFKGTVNHFSFTQGIVMVIQSKDTQYGN
ncbi:thiamine diphosphokinase [Periweissella cryptocerci]|uniref:Thiamine diphosphokinase n=1 Tax=Periweissella cryptocerci TaxID=2506420 RepID=A0A4P6YXB3_9LACO|nr:thiamine diphosphokinase [Periweissella cryptocerci]QBO37510.1 thiamine diphosphokinase [Periweissella cryptocerci]